MRIMGSLALDTSNIWCLGKQEAEVRQPCVLFPASCLPPSLPSPLPKGGWTWASRRARQAAFMTLPIYPAYGSTHRKVSRRGRMMLSRHRGCLWVLAGQHFCLRQGPRKGSSSRERALPSKWCGFKPPTLALREVGVTREEVMCVCVVARRVVIGGG